MIINEDFFDEIDDKGLLDVEQNDLENVEKKPLSPANYKYLFVIGISSTKVTDYLTGQLENMMNRISYILDSCNFITEHSDVRIVTRDESNMIPDLVELTDKTYYHMSFNITFAINCEVKRIRPLLAFMGHLLYITEKNDITTKTHKIEVIKRSANRNEWNADFDYHKTFECSFSFLKNALTNKKKSYIDYVTFNKILDMAFQFNKSVKTYKDICAIFGLNYNKLISKQVILDVNNGWADSPGSKHIEVTGIKFLTNKIKKKSVAGYLNDLNKSSRGTIWKDIATKIRLYSIPDTTDCLTTLGYMRDNVTNYAISQNLCPDDIYIRQFDNNRRLMVVMHLTPYYDKNMNRVIDVWCSINDFCFDSDKHKWVEIFKTIGENVTDKDIDDFWNKLEKPLW